MSNSALPPESAQPNASEILKKFLEENNIELRLTPPLVRQVDGGGVLVEQPQVVAQFKAINSIKPN